jgi:hypothetical protein
VFGKRKVTAENPTLLTLIGELQTRVAGLESQMRTLDTEQANLHAEVRKWMRRAVAAERRVEESNQEPVAAREVVPVTPTPHPQTTMWGARGRIAARKANGATNGLHQELQPGSAPAND